MIKFLLFINLGVIFSACSTSASKIITDDSTIFVVNDSLPVPDSSTVLPVYTIPVKAKHIVVDKLNQLYLITARNEVIKYDSRGQEVFRFNNNFLEDIGKVDPQDPFNVLVFYPDYLSVITLDRTMNKTGEFDLSKLNLLKVNALGSTNDNNVWLYDEVTFTLKKVNRAGQVLKKSVNLNLQLNYNGRPNFLIERENLVFLNDPDYGIIVFSNFGEYDSVLDIKGLNRFQVLGNQLVYQRGIHLHAFHLQTLNDRRIPLPVRIESGDQILLQKQHLFVKRDNRVEVYNL